MVMAKETELQKAAGAVWHGMFPDDAWIYRRSGWNFLMGANLKPDEKAQAKALAEPKANE
jgi:hypothetical protein